LTSLTVTPTSFRGGSNATGKVVFNAPMAADTPVALAVLSGGNAVMSMPASVVVPAAFSSMTFPIQTNQVTVSTAVQISATAGVVKKATFTATPIIPSSVSFLPSTVTGGNGTTGSVVFPAPLSQNTVVSLAITSGAGAVASIPANITVTAGSSKGTFPVVTNTVGATTTVKVSATANGGSKTGSFTVK
jgi:hypothetical protein